MNIVHKHATSRPDRASFVKHKKIREIVGRFWQFLACGMVLLLLPWPGRAVPSRVKLPHTEVEEYDLANGLRALLVENHQSPVVCVEVWYHVGSKDEATGRTGFAHLFEHLMFQGTRNLGPDEFSNYIVRSGGVDNAYTTEDATVFWENIPSSNLPVALWLEADRMRGLHITEKSFKTEREVVKEERRQRFDNQPYGNVVETLYRQAFSVHPYGHMTIGSMEDLDSASLADIQAFYDTYYQPGNADLVIVGDFDTAQTKAQIDQYFGPLPAAGPIARSIPKEPPQAAQRVFKIRQGVALPAFVKGYHMPADGTADAYPLRLASRILSEGESSRIYQRLVYDEQIALEAQANGNFTEDPNLFFVFAVMNQGHVPAEGETAVQTELERMKNELVSPVEIEKAKNEILRDFIVSRESNRTTAEELGYAGVILKDPQLLDLELNRFMSVSAEDIQRVARKYFVPGNATLVEVYPLNGQEQKGSPGK